MSDTDRSQQLELRVREACSDLRDRLRGGEDCRAEAVFARHAELADDPESALEILYTEFVTREELGLGSSGDDLFARFPQWKERLQRLLAVHAGLVDADTDAGITNGDTPFGGADTNISLSALPVTIGAYEVLELIGRGGMGAVFKARHRTLKRMVALKRLLGGEWASAAEGARFRTEAETISRLDHPNIVRLFEVGEHGGEPYLILELVNGQSLADALARGPMPPLVAAELVERLARALQHAHERGVLHRDLKPANILLKNEGTKEDSGKATDETSADVRTVASSDTLQPSAFAYFPKITDFGLAKRLDASQGQTKSGTLLGTPAYLAPERIDAQNDSPRADIYSLGVVLYECLTGRPPFLGDSALATLMQVRERDPVPPTELQPDCPRDLATICMQCMQKDPQRRYPSAAALADDLQRVLQGEPIKARATGALERAVKWSRRRPAVAALLTIILLLAIGGASAVTYLWRKTASALEDTAGALQKVDDQRRTIEETLAGKLLALANYDYSQDKFDDARAHLLAVPQAHRDSTWRRLTRHVNAPQGQFHVNGRVHLVVFRPDSRYLAVQTLERKDNLWIWDTAAKKVVHKLSIPMLIGFYFQPDSDDICAVEYAGDAQTQKRWMTVKHMKLDGSVVQTRTIDVQGGLPTVFPSARKAACVATYQGKTTVQIWNLETGERFERAETDRATGFLFSVDGKDVGIHYPDPIGGKGWRYQIVDLQQKTVKKEFRDRTTYMRDFSPDFKNYYSVVRMEGKDAAAVTLYDADTDMVKWERKQKGIVSQLAFSADCTRIGINGDERSVCLLDANTGAEILALRGHTAPIAQVRFSRDRRLMASSDTDGHVRIWTVEE